MKLLDKMKMYPTVNRDNCPRCGNPWYFEKSEHYECTTCNNEFPKAEIPENRDRRQDINGKYR